MKLMVSRTKLGLWICAFTGILSMYPFFVWDTFCGGVFNYLTYLCYAYSIYFLLFSNRKRYRITQRTFVYALLLLVLCIYTYIVRYSGSGIISIIAGFMSYGYLIAFVMQDAEIKRDIFEKYIKLFIISMIPGLIFYVLELAGISLSIGTLQSTNQMLYENSVEYSHTGISGYYKLYPGAVMRVNENTRFSGIYDEAGLVGTISVLALAAKGFNLKYDKECRWLLFFSLICFSFAGYVLIALYYLLRWVRRGQWKLIGGIALGIIALVVILNVKTDNDLIRNIQNRFVLTETGLSLVNNRETSQFEKGYYLFSEGGLATKLLGLGMGSASANRYMIGGSSYKYLLYDFGYLGFGLMLVCLLLFYPGKYYQHFLKYWDQTVLMILFLVSVYQRPAVMNGFYFIVLYGGCAFLETYKKKPKARRSLNSRIRFVI